MIATFSLFFPFLHHSDSSAPKQTHSISKDHIYPLSLLSLIKYIPSWKRTILIDIGPRLNPSPVAAVLIHIAATRSRSRRHMISRVRIVEKPLRRQIPTTVFSLIHHFFFLRRRLGRAAIKVLKQNRLRFLAPFLVIIPNKHHR